MGRASPDVNCRKGGGASSSSLSVSRMSEYVLAGLGVCDGEDGEGEMGM